MHILGAASSCHLPPDTFLAFGDGPRLCRPADGILLPGRQFTLEVGTITIYAPTLVGR